MAVGLDAGIAVLVDRAQRAATEVLPGVRDADFRTQWKALAGLGVLSAPMDGAPDAVTRAVTTVEGLGRAGVAAGICYAVTSQIVGLQLPLRAALGDSAWIRLSGVLTGDVLLCHALTEEGGGSDPLAMTTYAVEQPGGAFLLSGRKAYVTAAPVADLALVFARTDEHSHPFALTPFLVDLHTEGVARSEPFAKVALPEVPMGALDFHDVQLPPDAKIGEVGSGLALLTATTAWERALLLAYALGPMQRVLDRTVEWARDREQFGRKMGASHLVAGRVADMAMALHRARQLVYGIARRLDGGETPRQLATDAALTKISVSEDYIAFTGHAATLGGVRSFVEETGLTADPFAPLAGTVYAGPNDLLRVAVARALGLPVRN